MSCGRAYPRDQDNEGYKEVTEKKFLDVFSRYTPSDEKAALLDRATNASFRYSKDSKEGNG